MFVIDAKQYSGKVHITDGGFRGPRLIIAGRDRPKLLDGLDRQVSCALGVIPIVALRAVTSGLRV